MGVKLNIDTTTQVYRYNTIGTIYSYDEIKTT